MALTLNGGSGSEWLQERVHPQGKEGQAMTCLKPEHSRVKYRQTCLGSTCMKWAPSGELSDVDLNMILEKLARVDPNISGSKDAEGLFLAVASADIHPA